jgi:hypothetical protein
MQENLTFILSGGDPPLLRIEIDVVKRCRFIKQRGRVVLFEHLDLYQ